jgi:2-pyrone-4,6-dicarboxylate lactonase
MDADVEMLLAMAKATAIDRHILVQPSIYAADNSCLLAALETLGNARARGVIVVDKTLGMAEIDRLHKLGVRGLRLNLKSNGMPNRLAIQAALVNAVKIAERHNWHIQLFIPPEALRALADQFLVLPVPVVLDHFGLLSPHHLDEPTLSTIKRLLDSGNCWIKLSGTYRIAKNPTHPDVGDLARQLFGINGDRCVWASDWPHTPKHNAKFSDNLSEEPFQPIDTVELVKDALGWLSHRDRTKLFRDNPKTLYDFDK